MTDDKSIFGCFFKVGFDSNLKEQDFTSLANAFRPYIWGNKGICNALKKLNYEDYGNDLVLALFQFSVKPVQIELQNLKEIESYRKKERAIGIPIIITDENFFSKSEENRYRFLAQSILQKLDLLSEVVKKKKLDTNVTLLKRDTEAILLEKYF